MSIVSHGHGLLVRRLLAQVAATGARQVARVVLTHNQPDALVPVPPDGWPFELIERFNPVPAGFGANHNRAFGDCATTYFCVLNPDIELLDADIWNQLVCGAQTPKAGCAYPVLLNPDHSRQDSERAAITPLALLRRHLLRQSEARTDWVSAAFWLVPARVYRQLGGFDERYFMYCEDTDFCLRLQLAGWTLVPVAARAVHPASRSSRRAWRPLGWHLRSLWRLWTGPVLPGYLRWRGRP